MISAVCIHSAALRIRAVACLGMGLWSIGGRFVNLRRWLRQGGIETDIWPPGIQFQQPTGMDRAFPGARNLFSTNGGNWPQPEVKADSTSVRFVVERPYDTRTNGH